MPDGVTDFKPKSRSEQLGILGLGLMGNKAIVWAFDFALYPWVMWQLGLFRGWVAMTLLSALACYATLLFYDWAKKDWLGIEAIKSFREDETDLGKFGQTLRGLLRRSRWFALVVLSIKFDAFVAAVYLRPGSYLFNGMSRKDWENFFLCLLIANIYWSIAVFSGISLVSWAWKLTFT